MPNIRSTKNTTTAWTLFADYGVYFRLNGGELEETLILPNGEMNPDETHPVEEWISPDDFADVVRALEAA